IPPAFASGGLHHKIGVVQARALVLGQNGQPIFAEYDDSGAVVAEIGERHGDLDNAYVLSGDVYRAVVDTYRVTREANKGSFVLTRDAYAGHEFGTNEPLFASR